MGGQRGRGLCHTWNDADYGQGQADHEDGAEQALPAQQLVRVQVHVAQQELFQDHLPSSCACTQWQMTHGGDSGTSLPPGPLLSQNPRDVMGTERLHLCGGAAPTSLVVVGGCCHAVPAVSQMLQCIPAVFCAQRGIGKTLAHRRTG